ncbi:hypothetical protein Dsui_0200 [Azospira oryzae PS]|uniref:Uncharacterized protein n=1 Tax=Azospira oryzae (strain ATCC BAA-33 / DSM 13638 / PS) TaxID=640081 RepID=G8QMP0_AZOOP|nr:hypothetical protein [Azospira oryzae]AEV24620.1 hypothetical protein Dsui_0200 [Azospira oryzae PS]
MNRETIYSALFDRLKDIPGIVTASRRLRHWSDVGQGDQPALFQAQKTQTAVQQTGTSGKWLLPADLYLYVQNQSADGPSAALNTLIDAVEAALAPDNPIKNTNTLGGLVEYCRIEGVIETDEGTLGDQAVAIVPVVILTT